MNCVLDTTVLIDLLRGDEKAAGFLESLEAPPACSEITRLEVIRGLRSSERAGAEKLFSVIRWIPVTEEVARVAGEFGRKYRRSLAAISNEDLVIAATAKLNGSEVATSNAKHYPMFAALKSPY